VRLEITTRRAKFKLGQNRPAEARRRIIRELRERGRALDGRAADALEWTLSPNGGGTAHVPAPGPPAHRSP